MSNNNAPAKPQKWKIAVIPVLAIVLATQLFGGSSSDAVDVPDVALPADGGVIVDGGDTTDFLEFAPGSASDLLARLDQLAADDNEVRMSLTDVARFDPFALTGTLAARSQTERSGGSIVAVRDEVDTVASDDTIARLAAQQRLEAMLAESPMKMLTTGPGGGAAKIGEQVFRIGDFIEDGLQIVDINNNGIVVEPVK